MSRRNSLAINQIYWNNNAWFSEASAALIRHNISLVISALLVLAPADLTTMTSHPVLHLIGWRPTLNTSGWTLKCGAFDVVTGSPAHVYVTNLGRFRKDVRESDGKPHLMFCLTQLRRKCIKKLYSGYPRVKLTFNVWNQQIWLVKSRQFMWLDSPASPGVGQWSQSGSMRYTGRQLVLHRPKSNSIWFSNEF